MLQAGFSAELLGHPLNGALSRPLRIQIRTFRPNSYSAIGLTCLVVVVVIVVAVARRLLDHPTSVEQVEDDTHAVLNTTATFDTIRGFSILRNVLEPRVHLSHLRLMLFRAT